MKKTRFLALLLALVMSIGVLAACGNKQTGAAEPATAPAVVEKEEESKIPDMAEMYAAAISQFEEENKTAEKGQIVLSGSSLMAQFPINDILKKKEIDVTAYNRGIGGNISTQLLEDIDTIILPLEPSKLFINIGTNDLDIIADDYVGDLVTNYHKILEVIQERIPDCQIYLLAYYPPAENSDFQPPEGKRMRTLEDIQTANVRVEELAEEMNCGFIDLTSVVAKDNGYMKDEYSVDGIHMTEEAYNMAR